MDRVKLATAVNVGVKKVLEAVIWREAVAVWRLGEGVAESEGDRVKLAVAVCWVALGVGILPDHVGLAVPAVTVGDRTASVPEGVRQEAVRELTNTTTGGGSGGGSVVGGGRGAVVTGGSKGSPTQPAPVRQQWPHGSKQTGRHTPGSVASGFLIQT